MRKRKKWKTNSDNSNCLTDDEKVFQDEGSTLTHFWNHALIFQHVFLILIFSLPLLHGIMCYIFPIFALLLSVYSNRNRHDDVIYDDTSDHLFFI